MRQPVGFDENQIIGEMARIGRMWGNVFFEGYDIKAVAHLMDEHLISRTDMVVCRHCARVIGDKYDKHELFSCPALAKEEKWRRRRDRLRS